ncbi:discoidin domain-containing protein [Crocinitomix sp.]|nr:discoidin domain-containing protein [Crocinitomix sp.]
MKRLINIIAILLFSVQLYGQCYPDRHNTSWFDGWLSCEKSESPNEERGESHWISYDFGKPYKLNALKIWNVNDPDIIDNGAKSVMIDYSIDGIHWFEYGLQNFPKATGTSIYEGNVIAQLSGIKARYLLFTIMDNYGGDCYGFSEMRVAVDTTKDENEDVCIIAEVYPNPFQTQFSVFLEKKCLGDVFVAMEDATGRTVIEESIINLYDTKIIDAESLVPGVYFVCLRNGEIKQRYKIVKL